MTERWLTARPLDLPALIAETCHPSGGALVVFEGDVRDIHNGRGVVALRYDGPTVLAARAIERIERELRAAAGILAVRCVHRLGEVPIGDAAVLVVVRAVHREAAFEVARRAIDRIKSEAPIYKHESYADGAAGWQPGVPLVNPDRETP